MTLDIHNWSSSSHQELPKIVKNEIYPIVNQVDAMVQNFKIQFLKKAAKFVRDFKYLANEANESLAKHKALEFEIERLLRVVVNQDIMSIVQNPTVVETSDLQTELKLQLGDLKGKIKDTSYVSDTLDPLSHKLDNENVELEFQDITKGTSVNTKFANQSTSRTKLYLVTPFSKSKVISKVVTTNDLSKPVTSNLVPTTTESNVVINDKVIAPGMFRINPFKTSREDKFVPINKVRASDRTNSITILQPRVITKKDVNSNSNGLSSTGVDITTKSRRPQPMSNKKMIWSLLRLRVVASRINKLK
nr:hypothetical protein [Tanacetum cinerariifolium]